MHNYPDENRHNAADSFVQLLNSILLSHLMHTLIYLSLQIEQLHVEKLEKDVQVHKQGCDEPLKKNIEKLNQRQCCLYM